MKGDIQKNDIQKNDIQKNCIPIILCTLIILAAVLRFYHLDYNSIWLDEAATYTHSLSLSSIFDYATSVDFFNPPLFFLFEFVMIQITGASEFGLRFFPALFGFLTIPAAYFMGREFKDEYTGVITAAIFTLSPFLIYYSQEARAYSLLLFLCTVLTFIFLKALKSNSLAEWVGFGLVSAAIFCTHFYGAIFVAGLVIFAAVQNRSDIRSLMTGVAVGAFFSLPLIALTATLYFQRTAAGAPTYGLQGSGVIVGTLFQLTGFAGGYTSLIIIIGFASGLIWLVFKDREHAILLLWITASTFIISILAAPHIPILPRYMIFLMIPLTLGISSLYTPITNLVSRRKNPVPIVIAFILVFAFLALPFYNQYYTTYYKEDWRGVSQKISDTAVPGDVIVPLPAYLNLPLNFYYNATEHGTTIFMASNLSELKNSTNPNPLRSTYYIITYDITVADPSLDMLRWTGWNKPITSEYGNIVILKR